MDIPEAPLPTPKQTNSVPAQLRHLITAILLTGNALWWTTESSIISGTKNWEVRTNTEAPKSIEDIEGVNLNEKIRNFILQRVQAGDPTMKQIQNFLHNSAWEIHFMTPQEASVILEKNGRHVPWMISEADAYVAKIPHIKRKDGGEKNLGIVILNSEILTAKYGFSQLAGTITNELIGLMVSLEPKTSAHIWPLVQQNNWKYVVSENLHQLVWLYLLEESISTIADEVSQKRMTDQSTGYYADGEELWKSLCQNLLKGKITDLTPDNYAHAYFENWLRRLGISEEVIQEETFNEIKKQEYQKSVDFMISNEMKETVFQILKFTGTIR